MRLPEPPSGTPGHKLHLIGQIIPGIGSLIMLAVLLMILGFVIYVIVRI